MRNWYGIVLVLLSAVAFALIKTLLASYVIMLIWNSTIVDVFGIRVITLEESVTLFVLARVLVGDLFPMKDNSNAKNDK